MYAETGLMYPYFQSFTQEVQQLDDFCCILKPNDSQGNIMLTSIIPEYDLGEEGDLFKAPEPIIEEPAMSLDTTMDAISMISCGEDVISPQGLKVSEINLSLENGQLLSEFFYECKKDLLAKEATETPLSEVLEFKVPLTKAAENLIAGLKVLPQGQFPKSVSSGNLSSLDGRHGGLVKPSFLDFSGMDFGNSNGMRRAYSEGDIKTLGNDNISLIHSPLGQPQVSSTYTAEVRQEQLSRYRTKKSKRNFGRKIKYACRKALADNQPRIRGRFAKTEEIDASKRQ